MVRVIPMSVGPTAVSGVIGTDTAIGGGDTNIPVWAKGVLGMSLAVVPDIPTTAQTVIARSNVTSNNDAPIQPMHGLAAPLGATLGAALGSSVIGKNEKYDINMTVSGGELLTPNIRTLTTVTLPYGVMSFLYTDARPADPHTHYQCGTATVGNVASNTETNGTMYSLSGAREIVELIGITSQVTTATAEGYAARLRYQSAEFAGVNTVDLIMNPNCPMLPAAGGLSIAGVSRQACRVPIQAVSQCNVQDSEIHLSSANLGVGPTFISGVGYIV